MGLILRMINIFLAVSTSFSFFYAARKIAHFINFYLTPFKFCGQIFIKEKVKLWFGLHMLYNITNPVQAIVTCKLPLGMFVTV